MQNTTNIKKELDKTTNRLDELTEMRAGLNTNLETLRQGFIDGKTSLDALQSEQNKLMILDSSIKSLEAKQDELHTDLKNIDTSETRQKTLETMKTLSDEAAAAFSDYVNFRTELAETCRTVGEKMLDALLLSRKNESVFESLFNKLVPGVENYRAVTVEQRESFNRAKDELKEIGLSDADFNGMKNSIRQMPPNDFSEPIFSVQHIIASDSYSRTSKAAKA